MKENIEQLRADLRKHMKIRAIAAIANDRVIGKNNKIPWDIPEDLKFFRKTTSGCAVLMGNNTFKSIGKPLPNRKNIVLSSSSITIPGVNVINNVSDLLKFEDIENLWVIGGATIYELMLPLCNEIYLSRIQGNYVGDTFFPEIDKLFTLESVIERFDDFMVEKWICIK